MKRLLSVVSYQFSVREEDFARMIFAGATFAIATFAVATIASCFETGVAAPDFQLASKFA